MSRERTVPRSSTSGPSAPGKPTSINSPASSKQRPNTSTRLLRVWSRRHLIEQVFRTLRHLLASDVCQVHSEDAYHGHLVLCLMASFVLYYTSRVIFKGRVTMDDMTFNLKHHWPSVD
jgi:hypothetical protein